MFLKHLDRLESYICQILLAVFVTLLFVQIIARQFFTVSITWIEEFSIVLFVWFAYFGASYAARIYAHNRVTFQLRALPRPVARGIEALGDLLWVGFNLVFIWYSVQFISLMKPFVKLQTLGWQMKWVYLIFPIAFGLMTIRIIQVNYMKLVLGVDPNDPEKKGVEDVIELVEHEDRAFHEQQNARQQQERHDG